MDGQGFDTDDPSRLGEDDLTEAMESARKADRRAAPDEGEIGRGVEEQREQVIPSQTNMDSSTGRGLHEVTPIKGTEAQLSTLQTRLATLTSPPVTKGPPEESDEDTKEGDSRGDTDDDAQLGSIRGNKLKFQRELGKTVNELILENEKLKREEGDYRRAVRSHGLRYQS